MICSHCLFKTCYIKEMLGIIQIHFEMNYLEKGKFKTSLYTLFCDNGKTMQHTGLCLSVDCILHKCAEKQETRCRTRE